MESKSVSVGGFIVKRYTRLTFKLSLQDARALEATKMEETVDKDKLKILYEQNRSIQGVSEIHYIQISSPS